MAERYKASTCWLLKSPRKLYHCNGLLSSRFANALSVISYKFYLKYIITLKVNRLALRAGAIEWLMQNHDFVSQLYNTFFTYRAETIRKIYLDRLNLSVILLIIDSELLKMDTPVKLNSSVV